MNASVLERLAVCSWSLQPATPSELFAQLEVTGIRRLQCAIDPLRQAPDTWGGFGGQCATAGVTLVSGSFTCVGEDYTTMESIRHTGGIVPDATWAENRRNIERTAELAAALRLPLVMFHAGFLPHDERDAGFTRLLERLRQVADVFAERGIVVALETGQETASALANFLRRLERPNVGVNFDPANMILYDTGDPIAALQVLAPWVKSCHLKDAVRTRLPGTWGEEVPVGDGEVDWPRFFGVLEACAFPGYYCFEREAGVRRAADIQRGRRFVEKLLGPGPVRAPLG